MFKRQYDDATPSSSSGFTCPTRVVSDPTDNPTDNDVLLGRGVSTNRHPGNVSFRNLVGQHVNMYVTSTKKQKTLISRSIVDTVNREWDPPGRFLEKQPSGLWSEVNTKKALEKTAQALRDGAFPLRKQLSEDFSDPSFLAAVFDTNVEVETVANTVAGARAPSKPMHPLKSNKGHRRQVSDPDPKRSKPNSPNYHYQELYEDTQFQLPPEPHLTGINFPSPQLQNKELEFNVGTLEPSTKKSHRKSRTFGGYSCSDGNVSELPMDAIFAMFLTPHANEQHQAGIAANDANQGVHLMEDVVQLAVQDGDVPMAHFPSVESTGLNQQLFQNVPMSAATPPVEIDPNMSLLTALEQQQQHQAGNASTQAYHGVNLMGGVPQHDVQDGGTPVTQISVAGPSSAVNQQPVNHMNNNHASPAFQVNPNMLLLTPLEQQQHQAGINATQASNGVNLVGRAVQQAVHDGGFPMAALAGLNQQLLQPVPMHQQQLMHNDHTAASPAVNQQQFQTVPTPQQYQQLMNNDHASASPAFQIDPNTIAGILNSPSLQGIQQQAMQTHQMGSSPHVAASAAAPWDMNQPQLLQNMQPQTTSAEQLMKSMVIVFEQTNTTQVNQAAQQPFHSFHQQSDLGTHNPFVSDTTEKLTEASTTGKTLSGVKRHRRHNTIASGDCYATHRSDKMFDMAFLKNIHFPSEPMSDQHSIGDASDGEQFRDFIFQMPLPPSTAPENGRHRRSNTTGHFTAPIGLPGDFDFSLDQPTVLNTIHEEIPHLPITAECGSTISSSGKTGVSSIHDTNEYKPTHEKLHHQKLQSTPS
ncbi:hypothetical protein ACHAWO_011505 [Cyclotella atomus]|uniref:DUF6824 domain-containing protein n=1 Tax=Cyclotella atomus TaxID=382360 RepID=A0ABD3MXC6_9STRA